MIKRITVKDARFHSIDVKEDVIKPIQIYLGSINYEVKALTNLTFYCSLKRSLLNRLLSR